MALGAKFGLTSRRTSYRLSSLTKVTWIYVLSCLIVEVDRRLIRSFRASSRVPTTYVVLPVLVEVHVLTVLPQVNLMTSCIAIPILASSLVSKALTCFRLESSFWRSNSFSLLNPSLIEYITVYPDYALLCPSTAPYYTSRLSGFLRSLDPATYVYLA